MDKAWKFVKYAAKIAAVTAATGSLVVLGEVAVLGFRTPRLPHAELKDLSGTVTASSNSKKVYRVLIFGDSVAGGVGCPSNDQALAGSVARAISSTCNVTVEWDVLGISGYTANDMREKLVPQLLDSNGKYDLCVISVGVNHVLSLHHPTTYALQLTHLLISLKRVLGKHCRILCNSMPPMEKFPQISYLWPLCDMVSKYASAIGQVTMNVCRSTKLATCVAWEVDKNDFTPAAIQLMMAPDGFHPASKACDIMAVPISKIVKNDFSLTSLFDQPIDRTSYYTVKHTFCEKTCIPFWVADMELPTAPCVQKAIENRAKHSTYGYTIQPIEMWNRICKWLNDSHQWKVKSSEMIFTSNLVAATANCLNAFTNEGDSVAMLLPLYHPLQNVVDKSGRRLVTLGMLEVERETKENGTSKSLFIFDPKRLKQLIIRENVRALIWCHPHNPGGRVWKKEELKVVVNICKEFNVTIISDEIHSDLMLWGKKHTPMQLVGHACGYNNIVTMSSPGKTFNLAGMHSGFVVIQNATLHKKYMSVVEHAYLHFGSCFATTSMLSAYTNDGRLWMNQLIAYLEQNVRLVEQFFSDRIPEIRVMRPDASFLVLLNCEQLGFKNSSDLIHFFRKKARVQLSDGYTFGGNTYAQYQRMNIGCTRDVLMDGLQRIEKAAVALREGRK